MIKVSTKDSNIEVEKTKAIKEIEKNYKKLESTFKKLNRESDASFKEILKETKIIYKEPENKNKEILKKGDDGQTYLIGTKNPRHINFKKNQVFLVGDIKSSDNLNQNLNNIRTLKRNCEKQLAHETDGKKQEKIAKQIKKISQCQKNYKDILSYKENSEVFLEDALIKNGKGELVKHLESFLEKKAISEAKDKALIMGDKIKTSSNRIKSDPYNKSEKMDEHKLNKPIQIKGRML